MNLLSNLMPMPKELLVFLIVVAVVFTTTGCLNDNQRQKEDEPTGPIRAVARSDPDIVYIESGNTPSITFKGDWSNGTRLEYSWDFGDGSKGTGVETEHVYREVGRYLVTLQVTDKWGRTDSDMIYVSVGEKFHQENTLPLYQTERYTVPVELYAQRIKVDLTYPSGQFVANNPSNEIIMTVEDTGGTVHYDTKDDTPDTGQWQSREIVIPNQDIIAAQYADFIITLQYSHGAQPIPYTLDYTVSY